MSMRKSRLHSGEESSTAAWLGKASRLMSSFKFLIKVSLYQEKVGCEFSYHKMLSFWMPMTTTKDEEDMYS